METKTAIEALVKCCETTKSADDALRFSQAVLNLANAQAKLNESRA